MAFIQGYPGEDVLRGTNSADSIYGYAGDDSLYGYNGVDTLVGGTDDDWLEGGKGGDTFVYKIGDGNDTIADYSEIDRIKFQSGTPKFSIDGNNVVITVGTGSNKGTITVLNAAKNGKATKTITYLNSNNDEEIWPKFYDINDARTGVTLRSTYGEDSFDVSSLADNSDFVTINASAVNHDIEITGNKKANKIIGGDGNDTIYAGKGNDTIWGGDGDDVYAFTGDAQGKNVIADYEMGDVIKITSGTVNKTATLSGKDYIFTVKSGDKSTQIIVKNAKNKYVQVEDSTGKKTWYPEDPIPDGTYYAGGTLYLLKGYRGDEFDVVQFGSDFAGKVYTINASEVTHDINITGNKYGNTIIGSGHDDTIDSGAGADYIDGGKGDDILIGGSGKDTFAFNKGEGNDKILDYEEGKDVVLLNDGITVSSKKTVGKNVILTLSDKSKVTVVGAAGKNVKVVGDDDDDDDEDVVFKGKTSATLLAGYDKDTFDVVGDSTWSNYASSLISINASAVTHALDITANKKSNYILGTFQNDTINAGAGADTIYGGAGNDILIGGSGKDTFVYTKGDGNDKITDYDEEDVISINGVEVRSITTAKNGKDYIISLTDKSKITVVDAVDKNITYSVGSDTLVYPEVPIIYNDDFTAATLKSGYSKDSFTPSDYREYQDSLVTIDASRVTHDMTITGNKLANKILGTGEDDYISGGAGHDNLQGRGGNDKLYGGSGNDKLYGGNGRDSLWGGKGSDTLYGGAEKDTFIYTLGDGNDTIGDFEAGEKIIVLDAEVRSSKAASGNVTFKIGSGSSQGSILVDGGADKVINIYDSTGSNIVFHYDPDED